MGEAISENTFIGKEADMWAEFVKYWGTSQAEECTREDLECKDDSQSAE